MFFFRKKQAKLSADNQTEDDSPEVLSQHLYKQNSELAIKNKTLSLLKKLYEISILTLDSKDLTKRITKTVQTDLTFELVGILLYNQQKSELSAIAFSGSERLNHVQAHFNKSFDKITIPTSHSTFLQKIIASKCMAYTENLADVWDSLIPKEMLEEISSKGHVKSSLAYPLISDEEVIGVLLISLNRLYNDIVDYEKESINSFINVIAVALDKALLSEQLQVAKEKLENSNKGQENLIHIMNHQIKGYLGVSKNIFAELLKSDDYGIMPDESKPLLKKGLESTDAGVNYVQGILKGTSAQSGTLPYDMKPVDVRLLVLDLLLQQKEIAEQSPLSLTFDSHIGEGNYNTVGDAKELEEAFKNLITNAIKYNTSNGRVSVSLTNKNGKIMFSVKDSGRGVTDEDKPKLFTAGGMGKDSMKYNSDASGFGLAFVKGVAEAHKGTVGYRLNAPEKGTTFFIEIPIRK